MNLKQAKDKRKLIIQLAEEFWKKNWKKYGLFRRPYDIDALSELTNMEIDYDYQNGFIDALEQETAP